MCQVSFTNFSVYNVDEDFFLQELGRQTLPFASQVGEKNEKIRIVYSCFFSPLPLEVQRLRDFAHRVPGRSVEAKRRRCVVLDEKRKSEVEQRMSK